MAAVNEAYEVLSDPGVFVIPIPIPSCKRFPFDLICFSFANAELRRRFDNGDDPNDPMSQQGGHPFQQGTHPFAQFFQQGGGGFPSSGFQFHFGHGH